MVWHVQKRPINVIVRRSSKIVRNDFKALNLLFWIRLNGNIRSMLLTLFNWD